jgi:hypothetical protein
MTAVFVEGFEAVIDNPDMIQRGWRLSNTAGQSSQNVMTVPSRTGTPGKGLMLRGPYGTGSLNYLPFSGITDFGMIDTGKSINSLWQAGGFVVGMSATFNKTVQLQIAPNFVKQLTYDGAQYYWAIGYNGTTWCVCYSTDLTNWTQTISIPANCNAVATISVMGSGPTATVMVGQSLTSYNSSYYYSTNMGQSWTATNGSGINGMKQQILTGNPATPIMMVASPASGSVGVYYQTSPSAIPVQVSGIGAAPSASFSTGVAKLVKGIACFSSCSGASAPTTAVAFSSFWECCPVSADMTNAANYVLSATNSGHQMVDITFFNNLWISVGHGGIYTAPNSGTPAAPAGPTVAWSNPVPTGASYPIYSVDTNGSIVVAVGADSVNSGIGAIYTSTDGANWTKTNRFSFNSPNATNSNCFTNVIWDGKQFVLTGGLNQNVIATSPDGIAWTGLYYPDYTEASSGACASPLGIFSGTITAGTYANNAQTGPGGYVPWNTSSSYTVGIGLAAAAAVTTNGVTARTVQALTVPGGTSTSTIASVANASSAVPTTNLTHFYEIIATAVPGTTNAFTFQFAIDGVTLSGVTASLALASSTDTTGAAHLLLNLPRTGNWTVVDDIYVTTMSGTNNAGQLGPINVLPWLITGDAQVAMTPSRASTSNAALAGGPLSNAEGFVSTMAKGAQDVYNASVSIPANYAVCAVQAEAYFTKNGIVSAQGKVGVVSNGTEVDSSTITTLGTGAPTFASVLLENDPNTNTAWTTSGVQSARIAVTKAN